MATTAFQIQQLYIAYFGRPADPAGLDYWVSTEISTKNFAAAMYAQPEFQQANAGLPVIDQVNALYLNLFGRSGDTDGLLYWTQQINTGKLSLASIANDLIFAANNNQSAQSQLDKIALNNKTATALAYTGDVRETSASLLAYNPTSSTPWVTGPQFTSAVTYLAGVTQTAPTAAATQAAVDAMTAITPPGQTFTLTTNPDTFGSATSSSPQTFDGALINSLSVFDVLTGGLSGQDSLSANLTTDNTASGITVTGVENVSIVTSDDGFTFNTATNGFSGVTKFTLGVQAQLTGAIAVNTSGAVTINSAGATTGTIAVGATTAATDAVNISTASSGTSAANAGTIGVTGGSAITITSTATNTGNDNTNFTQGIVTVTGTAKTTSASVTQSALTAKAAVSGVTESASVVFNSGAMAAGDTMFFAGLTFKATAATSTAQAAAAFANLANGAVTGAGTGTGIYYGQLSGYTTGAVTSGTTVVFTSTTANTKVADLTTAVANISGAGTVAAAAITVTQGVAAVTGVAGAVAGAVNVLDVNRNSSTVAGTINNISIQNAGAVTINSGALQTLSLGGTLTTVDVTQGALTTPAVSSLALNLNSAISSSAVTIDGDIKTLNITSSGTGSILNSLVAAGATSINVSGTGLLALTAQTITAALDITSTNTAGVSFGNALATGTSFTGGDGEDIVTFGASTRTNNMGAGNDSVTYGAAMGVGGSINAGSGTNTIIMTSALANAADASTTFNSTVSNFQTLEISDSLTATLDLALLNGVSKVTLASGGSSAVLSNFQNNGILELLADSTSATVNITDALATPNNSLNIQLSKSGAVLAGGTITAANVEAISISAPDDATAGSAAAINTLTLAATSATSVVVTGNNGLNLTNSNNVAITNFNASGVIANGSADTAANLAVTFASANTTASANVTITGGAGNDTLTGNASIDTIFGDSGNDNLVGGSGDDFLIASQGVDVLDGGADIDTLVLSQSASGTLIQTNNPNLASTGVAASVISFATSAQQFSSGNTIALSNIENIDASGQLNSSLVMYLNGSSTANKIIGGAGNDAVGAASSATTSTGADTLAGSNGADWIFGSTLADALFGGNFTTATSGLYAQSTEDVITGSNAIFTGLFGTYGAFNSSVTANANIYEGKGGNDILVATNQKDVFFYQDGDGSTANTSTTTGTDLGTDTIQNFQVGTDVIMIALQIAGGDNNFYGSQSYVNSQNALAVGGEQSWLASTSGWSWNQTGTAAGTLTYNNAFPAGGGGTQSDANFSINFTGLQGDGSYVVNDFFFG